MARCCKRYRLRETMCFFLLDSHGNELYFPAFTILFSGNGNPDVILSIPRIYFLAGLHASVSIRGLGLDTVYILYEYLHVLVFHVREANDIFLYVFLMNILHIKYAWRED